MGPEIFFILRCSYADPILFIFLLRSYSGSVFFYFFSLDCAIDLNLISNEDMEKLRNSQMFKNEYDSLSIRMALGVINFCLNMLIVEENKEKPRNLH